MASTYSTNLKIELQATGENSGTWGTITNTNLGTALEQAIVGYGNPSYASDANLTLTYTDTNAAQAARALVLNVTSAVSLTATRELVVPTIQKQYIVQNNTTGSQSITVKTSAGTGITVPNGRKAHLYVDGTNVIYMDDYVDINGGAIDGTPIGASSASTGAFTTLSASGNFTLSGGTANGVLYLNGSKVATSGSALVFDGTNLGLGTSSNKTTVVTGGATGMTIAAVGAPALAVWDTTDASYVSYLSQINESTYFGNNANGPLYFQTNAITRATLDSSGNLGIGGTPTYRLDVFGTSPAFRLKTAAATTGFIVDQNNSDSLVSIINYENAALRFGVNATEGMRLTSTGLGIGTTSPAGKFQVSATNNQVWAKDSATGDNLVTQVASGAARINAYTSANAALPIIFSHYITDVMTINASGNLGLGVTPSAWASNFLPVLQIKTGTAGAGTLCGTANDNFRMFCNAYYDGAAYKRIGAGYATVYQQDTGGHYWFTAGTSTAGSTISFTQAMTLGGTAAPYLLVGTTNNYSSYAFQTSNQNGLSIHNAADSANIARFAGGGNISLSTSGNFAIIDGTDGILFGSAATERARITAGGNLLVGTTTDVSGLSGVISDVSGNVRAIPQSGSDKTGSYTLVKSDVGKFIGVGSGGSITVPDATFATGDVVSVFNNTTGNVTLTMTITTAYIGGTNTDKATITLATRGVATILFISGTVCVVNGNVS